VAEAVFASSALEHAEEVPRQPKPIRTDGPSPFGDDGEGEFTRPVVLHEGDTAISRESDRGPSLSRLTACGIDAVVVLAVVPGQGGPSAPASPQS